MTTEEGREASTACSRWSTPSGAVVGGTGEREGVLGEVCTTGEAAALVATAFTLKSGLRPSFTGKRRLDSSLPRGMSSILQLMFLHRTCTSNLMLSFRSSISYSSRMMPRMASSQGLGGRNTLDSFAPSTILATKEHTAIRRPVSKPQKSSSLRLMRRCSRGRLRARVICPSHTPRLRSSERSELEVVMLGDCSSLVTLW
mmetsp:Transcript_25204/g.55867  ORF Transcript_25204/g.55867 Transcript_25204/m.55867 type:complete len:200 (-) Transcript_25204:1161-1760(-)